jgi:hypothetical protein
LSYAGFIGLVSSTANFTLTGSLGSADISVSFLESLTSVRNRINLETATTGVVASVDGNNLVLTSTGVGSAASVAVIVNSGTFNVNGGNGNGTANGVDALLTINGQPVVAAGNDVAFTDALGSYTFSLVQGYTGAINPINVTSANGTFEVDGGNGDGTASGADAEATINGQLHIAAGNTFNVSTGGGEFVLEIAEGFSGALDPISITSSLSEFTIVGGNGNGTASGADGHATINAQTLTSTDGTFAVATAGGALHVSFLEEFAGAFDPFTVSVANQRVFGREGSSRRNDGATALINGQRLDRDQGWFLYSQNGVAVSLEFAPGFSGAFDPFTVSAAEGDAESLGGELAGEEAEHIRKLIAPLLSLASGGENAGLRMNRGRAIRLSAIALHELANSGLGQNRNAPRSLRGESVLFDQLG